MPHVIYCPHCATELRVDDGVTTPRVTCPRCSGNMPNPSVTETDPSSPASSSTMATVVAVHTPGELKGLGCLLFLLPVLCAVGTGIYAACYRSPRGILFGRFNGPVPIEVLLVFVAITTMTSVGIGLWRVCRRSDDWLPLLGAAGFAALYGSGIACFSALAAGQPAPLVVLLAALAVLALISRALVARRSPDSSKGPGITEVLFGIVILIGALAIGGVASLVLLFFACSAA